MFSHMCTLQGRCSHKLSKLIHKSNEALLKQTLFTIRRHAHFGKGWIVCWELRASDHHCQKKSIAFSWLRSCALSSDPPNCSKSQLKCRYLWKITHFSWKTKRTVLIQIIYCKQSWYQLNSWYWSSIELNFNQCYRFVAITIFN